MYFSIADLAYPRNSRIRDHLERDLGYDVLIPDEFVDHGGVRGKIRRLAALWKGSKGASLIVVAEFGQKYALPVWMIARWRRAMLIVDGFVGMYETHIDDWQTHGSRSVHAWLYRAIDKLALRVADLYLVDTDIRAKALGLGRRARRKVVSLPVGAPSWARDGDPRNHGDGGRLRLLYYGNYIPLHGLDRVVDALRDERLTGRIAAVFIGDGGLKREVMRHVSTGDLEDSVTFVDPVPQRELASYIQDSDVVLGIFGTSEKARTVIANKVWQGLAGGRVVLTRSSPALAEIESVVGEQLVSVSEGSPERIADELVRLVNNPRPMRFPATAEHLERYVSEKYAVFGGRITEPQHRAEG